MNSVPITSFRKHTHRHRRMHTHIYTHTWAWVETELRGALQGVDEWGLAKLPWGVQISCIHQQHSGPCGGEGGMKEARQKKSKTREGGERREKLRREPELCGKYVKPSKEERKTRREALQRQWNGIHRANSLTTPIHSSTDGVALSGFMD